MNAAAFQRRVRLAGRTASAAGSGKRPLFWTCPKTNLSRRESRTTSVRQKTSAPIYAMRTSTRFFYCFCVHLVIVGALPLCGLGQPSLTSEIAGRVFNASTGNYLNNARVTVVGRALETYTDENGEFRLRNVRAGEVVLSASFVGLKPQIASVRAEAGRLVRQDFSLTVAETEPPASPRPCSWKHSPYGNAN